MPTQNVADYAAAFFKAPAGSGFDLVTEFTITAVDRPTWHGYDLSIPADGLSPIAASTGGTFKPYLIEPDAPAGLRAGIDGVRFGAGLFHYQVVEFDAAPGRLFLANNGANTPMAVLAVDARTLDHHLNGVYGPPGYDLGDYARGWAVGFFYDTPVSLVDGTVELGRGEWYLAARPGMTQGLLDAFAAAFARMAQIDRATDRSAKRAYRLIMLRSD